MIKHWSEFSNDELERIQMAARNKNETEQEYIRCALQFGLFLFENKVIHWIKKYPLARKAEKPKFIELDMVDDERLMNCADKTGIPPHRIIRSTTFYRMHFEGISDSWDYANRRLNEEN